MGTLNRDPECFLHRESRVNSAPCANSLRKENKPKPLKRRLTRITKTRIFIIHLTRKPIPVPRGWPVQAHKSRALQACKRYHSLKFWRNCLCGLNCPGIRCLSASFHQPLIASCFTKQDQHRASRMASGYKSILSRWGIKGKCYRWKDG